MQNARFVRAQLVSHQKADEIVGNIGLHGYPINKTVLSILVHQIRS